jgi:hypothetical protein
LEDVITPTDLLDLLPKISNKGYIAIPSKFDEFSFLWSKIGQILGSIITPVIITSIFFLLFTPLSVILKIFRIKLLNVNIKKTKSSYWHERKKELTSMKRQF